MYLCMYVIPPSLIEWSQDGRVGSHQARTANRDFPVTRLVLPLETSLWHREVRNGLKCVFIYGSSHFTLRLNLSSTIGEDIYIE